MKKDDITIIEEKSPNSLQSSDKFDPYQACLKLEEEEVKIRTENEDQGQFASVCKNIRCWMNEILKLKIDNKLEEKSQWANEVEDRKVQVLMQMLNLRRLSRIQKVRVKDSREKTVESRQGVDGVTLKLQNLLYEVAHLKKEVRRCLEFESADKEIDLVPIEQFYKEAPESICRPEETVENPHEQRLAQLHWELEQRRGQTQLFDQLIQEKEKIASIISQQEAKLSSLAPRINSILETTRPLQTALNLPIDDKKEQQQQSQYLPVALYTLWVQVCAYQDACDSLLSVKIQGDLDAAKKLVAPIEDDKADASDSDAEMDLQEDNLARKSRSKKEKGMPDSDDPSENSLTQLLTLHPLYINLTVKTKDGDAVNVKFYYAINLKIVTTKCYVLLSEKSPRPMLTDVLDLNGDRFLDIIFAEDSGTASPNPSNVYQFIRFGTKQLTQAHLDMMGKPFKWAQTLAGLTFLDPEPIVKPPEASLTKEDGDYSFDKKDCGEDDSNIMLELSSLSSLKFSPPKLDAECISWRVSAEHMHNIIGAIRGRLQARLALHAQLLPLESATSIRSIPLSRETLQQHFPTKICSELRSWAPITWIDYELQPCTKNFIDAGLVNSDHFTFKACYERQIAKLEAYISISPDYPNVVPLFALSLKWEQHSNSAICPYVQQIENEVNVHWQELVSSRKECHNVLSLQLYRLAMCLDIFTEALSLHSDETVGQQASFHKEKIFFRPARGPDRALPFKYLPKLGVFAQR